MIQNFRLTPSFDAKLEKTFLTFLGFDGQEPMMYRLRVKTKEDAEAMAQALEKAVQELS